MKIALINKSIDSGGAAIACHRLMIALNRNDNVEAKIVAQDYSGVDSNIISTSHTHLKKAFNFSRFVWERLCFLPYEESKKVRFAFSIANTGEDISKLKVIQDADIIHLHWINQGFLSLKELKKLFHLGKPLVWTLHDMWPYTGGCHYSGNCIYFKNQCGNCFYLRKPSTSDLSNKIFRKKEKLYSGSPLTFVGCSKWMTEQSKESTLLKNFRIESIPNSIDIELYSPGNKIQARQSLGLPIDKKLLLFGAANIFDKRKGFNYLLQSLEIIKSNYPQLAKEMHCFIFGKAKHPYFVPLTSTNVNYVGSQDQMVELYRAADVFVLPSLQDNLPNTVMEAMSCGLPVVAFNTGGLPEMVKHKVNGYLADTGDSKDLADGIQFILSETQYSEFQKSARDKVLSSYHPEIIAGNYLKLYNELLNK
jgi:glycosyltransferase involved in cell wall biosynthesis